MKNIQIDFGSFTSLYPDQVEFNLHMNSSPVFLQRHTVGSYFKWRKYAYQPCWTSYNLAELKEIWETEGGIITDQDENIIFVKIQKEYQ